MNITSLIRKAYERNDIFAVPENKANSKPISERAKMNVNSVLTKYYNNEQRTMNNERLCKTNPIKPNFKGKKMLLHLTINGRRKSFRYYADEIEAAKAYDRVAKKYRVRELHVITNWFEELKRLVPTGKD